MWIKTLEIKEIDMSDKNKREEREYKEGIRRKGGVNERPIVERPQKPTGHKPNPKKD